MFQLQLIDQSGQKAVDNISTTIGRANSVLHDPTIDHKDLSDYKDLLNLSHKKEVLVGQSIGVLPTQNQSITVTNILNVRNGPSTDDIARIQELLQTRQAIDVDYQEIEDGQWSIYPSIQLWNRLFLWVFHYHTHMYVSRCTLR